MITLGLRNGRGFSALLLAAIGLFVLHAASMAETKEATCTFTTLWYDSRLTLTSVIEEGGGACFFEVAMPSDLAQNQPASEAAKWLQAAAVAPIEKQPLLLQEARQPLLNALSVPLLNDKRFTSIGGVELHASLSENYSEVVACSQSAFSGKPYSNQIGKLKVECSLGEGGNKTYTLALSYASVAVEVRVPLA